MHVGVPAALRGRRRALHPLLLASQKRMWVRMGADPTAGSPIGCNADYCNAMGGRRGGLLSSDALASFCSPMRAPGGSCRLDRHPPPPVLYTEGEGGRQNAQSPAGPS